MNTIWSSHIQKAETLYLSRELRFDDRFKDAYRKAFSINDRKRILEIGAGPGALTQALGRWYPQAEIIGSDRDHAFMEFARQHAPAHQFIEADATALPFNANSFDVVISNTVQEHIEPAAFFGEQYRVLNSNGICLVLSSRRGINIISDIISDTSDFENEMYKKSSQLLSENDEKNSVGKYGCSELELAFLMQKHGFQEIQTNYIAINLTPDSGQFEESFALKIIESNRRTHLDAIEIAKEVYTEDEFAQLSFEINKKYDRRKEQYRASQAQWDVNMSLIMVVRGVKR